MAEEALEALLENPTEDRILLTDQKMPEPFATRSRAENSG